MTVRVRLICWMLIGGVLLMAVAPHVAAWQRRMANTPGPVMGGSPPGGVPFLADLLGTDARIIVKAAFGADVKGNPALWNFYDITGDVRQADGQRVSISPVGRADETSQAQPAGLGLQLDNTTGDYTANHPGSKWWPNVRRNTPIQVQLYVNGLLSLEYQGYVNGWVPSWDTSGNLAVVTVSASGILRRLNQGKTPLHSALYRAVTASTPTAYWSLEDGTDATSAASGISGGTPLAATGTVSFSTVEQSGSEKIIDLSQGGRLSGLVPAGSFTDRWRVEWVGRYASGTAPSAGQTGIALQFHTTGTFGRWAFLTTGDISPVDMTIMWEKPDGTGNVQLDSGEQVYDGVSRHYRLDAFQSGGNIDITLSINGVSVVHYVGALSAGTLGQITSIEVNPVNLTAAYLPSIGHVGIWQPWAGTTDTAAAATGYVGETATARLARLCGEQGVPIEITGTSDTLMGEQGVATFISLLRECETTDDGLLYDGLGPGLGYITRQARYNRAASISPDMAADPPQVDDPFEPKDDDQRNRNIIKVDQKNGSSATFVDTDGPLGTDAIQDYDSSVPVNYGDESGLLARAAWEVHKGTVDGFRYPKLSLDLAATPALATAWLATPLAGRVDVLNVTSKATQHPPGTVSQLLEGYGAMLSPSHWTVAANCSPFAPWRVAVLEGSDTEYVWRLDSGGSTLHQDYPAGSTSLSVDVSDGYLWSTTGSDYPRDLDIGGVQVTCSAVSGGSSPQTFTVTATAYPLTGGSAVKLWRAPVLAL